MAARTTWGSRGARVFRACIAAAALQLVGGATALAGELVCEAPAAPPKDTRLKRSDVRITGGVDAKRGWMSGERGQLRIRKFSAKGGQSVIELTHKKDSVILQVSEGLIRVMRNGKSVEVGSEQSIEALQELLSGSMAVFHTRALLSELEGRSDLKAPEMSLLSAAAFVTSLTGDTAAPLRLSDRFVQKHRGIYRQVRLMDDEEASCWSSYEKEVGDSWNDLQACMDEADSSGGIWAGIRRLACNGTWLLRGESAWFEHLKCLSPLSVVPKLAPDME